MPAVIADLPRKIDGIDEIYTLVIDDGSTDNTFEVARSLGVDYIVRNGFNLGLSKTFSRGLEASLFLGADIIVNTDGDNQYKGVDIAKIVRPILEKRADVVVGCRNIKEHKEFSWMKKFLQRFGSKVVQHLSGTNVPDTTSGFRALSRNSAMRFSFMSDFSYTLEMLIQAGRTGLKVDWVPIATNTKSRDSRLFRSIPDFILKQLKNTFAVYLFYRPMHFFGVLASLFFVISFLLGLRIIYHIWFLDPALVKFKMGSSILLIFTSIVMVLLIIAGLLGSVLSGVRFFIIDIRRRIRTSELQQNINSLDMDIITAQEFFKWTRVEKAN